MYETVVDHDGFLWAATDNGISRFDGKRFINYTTKNGLPSNDVIQVIKQHNGTIWAICYKQPPSYFDAKLNRFICLEFDKHIIEMSNSLISSIYEINNKNSKELFFHNYFGSFVFSNGKIINKLKYSEENHRNHLSKLYFLNELITLKYSEKTLNDIKNSENSFYQKDQYLGSIKYQNLKVNINELINNNSIYRFFDKEITKIKILKLHPYQYNSFTIKVPETIKWYKFSNSKLSITCTNGTILIYDESTLKLLSTIKNTFNVNTAYVDKQNNVWVSTLNNGLMYYTNKNIKKVNFSKDVISNFLCVKVSDNGEIFAGNYQGEIYSKKGKKEIKYNFSKLKEK